MPLEPDLVGNNVTKAISNENTTNIATSAPDESGNQQQTPFIQPDLARSRSLRSLGVTMLTQYWEVRELSHLEAAIKAFQEAVDLTPEGHPDRAYDLKNLAMSLRHRYLRLGDLNDLEVALQKNQEAVHLTPEGSPDRAGYLQSLAVSFGDRYQRLGDLDDLQAALQLDQEAVDLTPQGHPDRATRLKSLAASFGDRYRRLGDLEDLEAALQLDQEAVNLTPEGNPHRAAYLQSLAVSFEDRYQRLGDLNDLQAALRTYQEAVDLTPEGHPDRAGHLKNLAGSLTDRYQQLGDLNDLEAALQRKQEAVDLTPQGHPDRAGRLKSLAVSFGDRYRRLGNLDDLEAALQLDQQAVNLTPQGNPHRADRLQSLAVSFEDRYHRLGDLNDLQAALRTYQEAADLTPEGHPDRASHFKNLAMSFKHRYQRLGDLDDLEVALKLDKEAVDLTPQDHPDRAGCLKGLAVSFGDRYRRLGDLDDLETALQLDQEAVNLTPAGNPHRADRLRSQAVSYEDRYRRLGDLNDLQAALRTYQEAVDLTPEGHPDRADHLKNLAVSFTDQYQRLGDLNDLEAAVQKKQEAVNLTPDSHPNMAGRLQSLAASFEERYRKLHSLDDLQRVHTHYSDSFTIPTSAPETSWNAALDWASVSEEFKSPNCITAYSKAFNLLPEILWMGNVLSVRHEAIHRLDIGQATSTAVKTCINFSDIVSAVEIMEQGLGITFQQMLQLRPDLDEVPPAQANELKYLSSELYSGTSPDLRDVAIRRENLLKKIRQQSGLEYFLLPKPYKALCHASQRGPVVVLNSHQAQCDVIILLDPTFDPVHVPLQDVTLDMLKSQQEALTKLLGHCNVRTREGSTSTRLFGSLEVFESKPQEQSFSDLLGWLWTHIVDPVYQVLESHGIHGGRLWWLPTGAFTGLPLHASPPMDEFIHSYTATLGSLLDAYAKKSPLGPRVGVVGVTDTGDQRNYLPGVKEEVKKIISIIKNTEIECLEDQQATVDAVKLQLQTCSWVHLACHGTQDVVDPTKSRLLLYGGSLKMETILRMPLNNAEFVFLAACQTAMGDARLMNESFHLGGGFIAAGFQGAIGTMWSMNDSDGPLVAETVYSHLFREGQQPQASDAAEALQLAVKELKARKVPYERWIPFIHMGV